MRTFRAEPRAKLLLESMRDLGYTLRSALADILDNSLAADAMAIDIQANTTDGWIAILDDGRGMTEADLLDAMRPGSRNPRDERSRSDLGRFGLGLKTASFSQCRRLTVVTRQDGVTAAARWDLDQVAETNDWLLELPEDLRTIPLAEELGDHGTLVVWEKLDRLFEGYDSVAVNARLVEAERHLCLTFHRFLAGERGFPKVHISLNNEDLVPFDPFNLKNRATQRDPEEKVTFNGHVVSIQAFTLPHPKKTKPTEWERLGGVAGYLRNQGFYVYRERRLIISGTWFGLARQTELTKLSRVRIDLPNGADVDWRLDVKKASAYPPPLVRDHLRGLIDRIGAASRRTYTARGQTLASSDRIPLWQRVQDKNQISYQISREHPVVLAIADDLDDQQRERLLHLLSILGAALPFDALYADLASDGTSVNGGRLDAEALELHLRSSRNALRTAGFEAEQIGEMLLAVEPFRSHEAPTRVLLERLAIEEQGND
jgi:hypothetical protein